MSGDYVELYAVLAISGVTVLLFGIALPVDDWGEFGWRRPLLVVAVLLLQRLPILLAVVVTEPSFRNFVTLMSGWIFTNHRTVTQMIMAAGCMGQKHHSSYHRLFALPAGRKTSSVWWCLI